MCVRDKNRCVDSITLTLIILSLFGLGWKKTIWLSDFSEVTPFTTNSLFWRDRNNGDITLPQYLWIACNALCDDQFKSARTLWPVLFSLFMFDTVTYMCIYRMGRCWIYIYHGAHLQLRLLLLTTKKRNSYSCGGWQPESFLFQTSISEYALYF